MPDEMSESSAQPPSETLRAAAARLRACSPFVLIAGRRVAVEPLATWLDQTGRYAHYELGAMSSPEAGRATQAEKYAPALAFAHSILEQP